MKKKYETPVAEKIEFAYCDQVVAASFGSYDCTLTVQYNYQTPDVCEFKYVWKTPNMIPGM